MLTKIVGHSAMSDMMKKLSGGPQSLLPMSPSKGVGVPSGRGAAPAKTRQYVVPMQKPKSTKLKGPWWK
jgi:hypothetical protein